jgi:hypothetical protein
MQKTFIVRFLVTVLAVGCVVQIVFFRPGHYGYFPFQHQRHGAYTFVIQPKHRRALPAGLQAGDRFDPREQNLAARLALHVEIRPGETYTFLIHRDGRRLKVPVTTRRPVSNGTPVSAVFFGLFMALMLVLGLATLWWGSDWTAWGLSLFALGIILNQFMDLPLPSVASFAALIVKRTVSVPLLIVGLYTAAILLANAGLTRRIRWAFHGSLALVLTAEVALLDTRLILAAMYGTALQFPFGILWAISLFIPVVALFTGYILMDTARRLRLHWVLWSLALFIAAIVWHNLNQNLHFVERGLVEQLVWWLVDLFALTGLIYGLLFKRLVRLSFIINRAAVYGLTAIIVVGIFALLGQLVQSFTIGGNADLALTLGVSLIVGLGLEAIKKRIDSLVERLFFRRKFLAESELRRFARQCAFIENPERLLSEAAAEVREYLQAPSVALYERVTESYARVRQRGRDTFPERIEIDDRAFVALRAELTEQDLHAYKNKSALGAEGYCFPMAVRGTLQGALVVGARPENYAPDERELLAHVVYQVGMALHALRTSDNEMLLKALASGALEPAMARERARQLFSMNL